MPADVCHLNICHLIKFCPLSEQDRAEIGEDLIKFYNELFQ